MTKLHYSDRLGSESAHSLADPGISTLQAVLDPRELGNHLNRVLAPELGLVRDIQTKVLLHHPKKRCTIDITLQTTTGKHELIGKVYAKDRSDVYRAMEEIGQSGLGPEEECSIPQPFAFIPELHLLLQEKVQGLRVTDTFLIGDELERAKAAERCAKWLAHFQMQAPRSWAVSVFTPEILERWLRRLVETARPLTDKAYLLFKRLEIARSELDHTEMCACHGDYCHKHIILDETRTVAFDWDNHCMANPCRDVASFIFDLQRTAVQLFDSVKALDAVIEVFYKTYTARSSFEVTKHLPFYKAAHCLYKAGNSLKVARFRLRQGSGGIEKTEALLDEGLRVLAEDV
jgi:aminoglycoside phosphotransferase (APT) family kinase protein